MRLHPLSILLSVPAIFLACSSGGPGAAPGGPTPNAYGSPGSTQPALVPNTPAPGGGQVEQPTVDSGTNNPRDTGSGADTNTVQDTNTGGDLCSTPSKCSGDPAQDPTTCRTNVADPKCGTQWRTYYTCIVARQVCKTDGSNTTDPEATLAACSAEGMSLSTCVNNP